MPAYAKKVLTEDLSRKMIIHIKVKKYFESNQPSLYVGELSRYLTLHGFMFYIAGDRGDLNLVSG